MHFLHGMHWEMHLLFSKNDDRIHLYTLLIHIDSSLVTWSNLGQKKNERSRAHIWFQEALSRNDFASGGQAFLSAKKAWDKSYEEIFLPV